MTEIATTVISTEVTAATELRSPNNDLKALHRGAFFFLCNEPNDIVVRDSHHKHDDERDAERIQ